MLGLLCPELAALWHQAWHDAHAQIVPTERTRLRPHFRQRIRAALANTRVIGPIAIRTNMVNLDEPHEVHSARSAGKANVALVDRFYAPGAYGPMQASHIATWHPKNKPVSA